MCFALVTSILQTFCFPMFKNFGFTQIVQYKGAKVSHFVLSKLILKLLKPVYNKFKFLLLVMLNLL